MGETWTPARLLPIMGVTCQGAAAHDPTAPAGELLLSAPSWPAGGLEGRRNVSVWTLNTADPKAEPISRMSMAYGMGGGYSAWDTTRGKLRILYESGPPRDYHYSVSLGHIDNFKVGGEQ